jgi:hypothetical protein
MGMFKVIATITEERRRVMCKCVNRNEAKNPSKAFDVDASFVSPETCIRLGRFERKNYVLGNKGNALKFRNYI